MSHHQTKRFMWGVREVDDGWVFFVNDGVRECDIATRRTKVDALAVMVQSIRGLQ